MHILIPKNDVTKPKARTLNLLTAKNLGAIEAPLSDHRCPSVAGRFAPDPQLLQVIL